MGVLKGTDFNRQASRACHFLPQPQRAIEILRADDAETADVFFSFGERTVRHHELSTLHTHDGGGPRRMKPAGEDPHASGLHLLTDGVHFRA